MWSPWNTLGGAFVGAAVLWGPAGAMAAELPAHDPMRILIISDEVNPHGLPDDQLTQPGELSAAIGGPGSGLAVDRVDEVASTCIDDALAMLDGDDADVVVYFAHLPASACDGAPRQGELTSAIEAHLQQRGGVVVFHHGIYEAGGKEPILQLLGGRASSVGWDTNAGQDVIAVAGGHFVTSQAMEYDGMRAFEGVTVPPGEYPYFNNTPDERYDALTLLSAAGEERTILFTSTDGGGGNPRVLGYDLWRPGWAGHVVFYQPGEYQPNSLDTDGNNFQVLANAIVYAATTREDSGEDTDGGTDPDPGDEGTGPGDDVVDDSGGPSATSVGPDDDGGHGSGSDGGVAPEQGDGGEDGCGCRSPGGGAGVLGLALVGLGLASRRRRRA